MKLSNKSDCEISAVFKSVHALSRNMLRNHDAEDLAQDVLLKLLGSDSIPVDVPHKWLFRVVQRSVVDWCRRCARERQYLLRDVRVDGGGNVCREDELVYVVPPAEEAEENEAIGITVNLVLRALEQPLREVLLMAAAGWSYQEMAGWSNVKVGTVRSRLHTARKRARQMLTEIA